MSAKSTVSQKGTLSQPTQDRLDLARALEPAFEPIIDLCLKLGVDSPQLESLLRVIYVHRAMAKLPGNRKTGRGPSHEAVGLAVGLNRNDVRKVLQSGSSGAKTRMTNKEQRHSKSAKLLKEWSTNSRFLTSGGLPRDLPIVSYDDGPSFEELVVAALPGKHVKHILSELRRRGLVTLLPDEIVRFRSESALPSGLTTASISYAATQLNLLGATLLKRLTDPNAFFLYETTKALYADLEELHRSKPALLQRTMSYLHALESEFGGKRTSKKKKARPETEPSFGYSVFFWQQK
jgi:hypothetical protein